MIWFTEEIYNGGIFSGYQSLLALHLSGTPCLTTGTSPLAAYTSTTVYIYHNGVQSTYLLVEKHYTGVQCFCLPPSLSSFSEARRWLLSRHYFEEYAFKIKIKQDSFTTCFETSGTTPHGFRNWCLKVFNKGHQFLSISYWSNSDLMGTSRTR